MCGEGYSGPFLGTNSNFIETYKRGSPIFNLSPKSSTFQSTLTCPPLALLHRLNSEAAQSTQTSCLYHIMHPFLLNKSNVISEFLDFLLFTVAFPSLLYGTSRWCQISSVRPQSDTGLIQLNIFLYSLI